MLIGVLAIAGIPLFSGWYSKDAILAQAIGFVRVHPQHALLFLLPLADGRHHDVLHVPHVVPDLHRQAARPPRLRPRPRVAVADDGAADPPGRLQRRASPGAGRSGTPRRACSSSTIHHAQPASVHRRLRPRRRRPRDVLRRPAAKSDEAERALLRPRACTAPAGFLALGVVVLGLVFAAADCTTTASSTRPRRKEQFPRVHAFLANKWYFDELYSVLLVRPGAGRGPLVQQRSTCT